MEGRSFKNSGVEFWNAKGKDATVGSENEERLDVTDWREEHVSLYRGR
jgi:hypothetical protein